MALLAGFRLYSPTSLLPVYSSTPHLSDVARTAVELVLLIVIFDRLVPQLLFTRTRGLWISRIRYLLEALFYLILPVTLLLGLLLSIAALAEPEDAKDEEHPSEAMDALLEAGEEEGILEVSDRELVRSVVEFGDKVVREVMTPRPQIYAVDGQLTLTDFTAALEENVFSRVPVYSVVIDHITGIVFAHDLLQIADTEAAEKTVAQLQRPAAFVPETKKVNELLREMQREKQHMRIVIDEYGGVAGLITIEDLIEAIIGNIADEHDEAEDDDEPVREPDGSYVVSGSFEVSRLRDLLQDQFTHEAEAADALAPDVSKPESEEQPPAPKEPISREMFVARDLDQPTALRLPEHYESTTVGGLVSEIAGHIPLRGEVVEEEGLRLEVLASTDRRIDRVRVGLSHPPESD